MIYRHYKGGLYFLEGYATPFNTGFFKDRNITIELVAVAKYEKTLEDVNVYLVHDESVNASFYSYNNDVIGVGGVMCFYKDVNGQYWLRSRDNFYSDVFVEKAGNICKEPRFSKLKGEHLFNVICKKFCENA